MSETGKPDDKGNAPEIDNEDLDLVDDALEDEGKDEAEIWADIDREETGATDDDDAAAAAAADDDGAPAKPEDESAQVKAEETGDEPTKSGDDSPDDAAAAGQDDPFADAPKELRDAYEATRSQLEKLKQSERSQRGRLAAMQRRINDLMSKQPAAADDAAAGKDKKGDGESGDFLETDDWKQFSNEYPEVAAPIKSLVTDLKSRIATHDEKLSAVDRDRHDAVIAEQEQLLENEHPDWQDVAATEEFETWISTEPRHVQEAAVRNAEEIVDATEAADLISRFKAFRSAEEAGNDASKDESNADAGKAGQGKDNGTTRLSGKRQRQLESASGTRAGGPGAAIGIPEDGDPEKLWDAFDKMEARQEAQRA